MSTEERKIVFSSTELMEALGLFCEQTGRDVSFDHKMELTFGKGPQATVTVSNVTSSRSSTIFYESEIAASLILLAKKNSIPIPRRAEKSLELGQDKITLVMIL